MRSKQTKVKPDGTTEERWVTKVPDALEMVLATMSLTKLTEEFEDGTKITYTAWEYECYYCGEYGHSDDDCPEPHVE